MAKEIKQKIKGIWSFYRAGHGILIVLAIFISEMLSNAELSILPYIAPLFAQFFAFALNDYLDYRADRINKRYDRPLVSGILNLWEAKMLIIFSFILAIIFSYPLPLLPSLTVILFLFLSILYDYYLKDMPLAGNIYIGIAMAIPFLYGNLFKFPLRPENLMFFFSVFMFGVGREIIKDIQDIKGDQKARGSSSLPLLIGKKDAGRLGLLFITISIILLLATLILFFKLSIISLSLMLLILYLLFIAIRDTLREKYERTRRFSFYAMVLSILTILISLL